MSTGKVNHNSIHYYPLPKTPFSRCILRLLFWLSHHLYTFNTEGIESIPPSGNFILCPNHQSHFDGLWIFSCIPNIDLDSLMCMAKHEHTENWLSRYFLRMLGGIPVDRNGNPYFAIKRSLEYLKKKNCVMLIHPEGTRTYDGQIGTFKRGAAFISIKSDTPVVPVGIRGAYEILPRYSKRLKIFRKPEIHIKFGKPIVPSVKRAEKLTILIYEQINNL